MPGARGAAAAAPGGAAPEGGWGLHAALKRRFADEVFGAVAPRLRDRGAELVCDGAGMQQVQALWKVHELTEHGVPVFNVLTPNVRRQPLPHNAVIYLIAHEQQSADLVCADWEPAQRPAATHGAFAMAGHMAAAMVGGGGAAAAQEPPPYAEAHVFFVDDVPRGSAVLKRIATCRELAPHIKSMKALRISFSCPEPHLFSLLPPGAPVRDIHGSMQRLFVGDPCVREQEAARVARGIADVLQTLGDCPMIRHQATSDREATCRAAKLVADALDDELSKRRSTVDPSRQQGTVLILDRSIDLASPLLHDFHLQSLMMDVMPHEPVSCPVDKPEKVRLLVLPPHPHRPAHLQLVRDMLPNSKENKVKFDDAKRGMTVCMSPQDDAQQKRYLCTVVDKKAIFVYMPPGGAFSASIGVDLDASSGGVTSVHRGGVADTHNVRGGYVLAAVGGTNLIADPSGLGAAWKKASVEAAERHDAAVAKGMPTGDEGKVLVKFAAPEWEVKWERPGDGGPGSGTASAGINAVRREWWEGEGAATTANICTLDDTVKLWCRLRHQHLRKAASRTVPEALNALQDTEWEKLQGAGGGGKDIAAMRRAFADKPKDEYKRLLSMFADIVSLLGKLWRPWEDLILFEQDLACREEGAPYGTPDNCPEDTRKRLDWLLAQDLQRDLLTDGRTCSAFRARGGAPPWAQRHDQQTRIRLLLLYCCCKEVPAEKEIVKLQEIVRKACSQNAHVLPQVPLQAMVAALQAFDVSAAKKSGWGFGKKKDKEKKASEAAVKVDKDADPYSRFIPAVKTLAEQLLAGDGAADGLPQTEYPYTSQGAGRGKSSATSSSADAGPKSRRPGAKAVLRAHHAGARDQHRDPHVDMSDGGTDAAAIPWSLSAADGPRHYVFVVGGLSYCESRAVAEVVAERRRAVIVGTTALLTPAVYIDGLAALGAAQGGAAPPA